LGTESSKDETPKKHLEESTGNSTGDATANAKPVWTIQQCLKWAVEAHKKCLKAAKSTLQRKNCDLRRVQANKNCIRVKTSAPKPSPKKHLEGATADAKPA
jgi:hypothetical protein